MARFWQSSSLVVPLDHHGNDSPLKRNTWPGFLRQLGIRVDHTESKPVSAIPNSKISKWWWTKHHQKSASDWIKLLKTPGVGQISEKHANEISSLVAMLEESLEIISTDLAKKESLFRFSTKVHGCVTEGTVIGQPDGLEVLAVLNHLQDMVNVKSPHNIEILKLRVGDGDFIRTATDFHFRFTKLLKTLTSDRFFRQHTRVENTFYSLELKGACKDLKTNIPCLVYTWNGHLYKSFHFRVNLQPCIPIPTPDHILRDMSLYPIQALESVSLYVCAGGERWELSCAIMQTSIISSLHRIFKDAYMLCRLLFQMSPPLRGCLPVSHRALRAAVLYLGHDKELQDCFAKEDYHPEANRHDLVQLSALILLNLFEVKGSFSTCILRQEVEVTEDKSALKFVLGLLPPHIVKEVQIKWDGRWQLLNCQH